MGVSNAHALGRERRFYVKAESTPGTFAKPAGTDAMRVRAANMDWQQQRDNRVDARATRSLLERITNNRVVTWDCTKYLIPSGTQGTAPDDGELWKALFGTETVNASTSVVYSLSSAQALTTLSIVDHVSDVLQQCLRGAYVGQLTISGSGGDQPQLAFSGGAFDYGGIFGRASVDGTHAAGTTFDTTAATTPLLKSPCVIGVNSDDNSGAGYEVTDVDDGTNQITLASSHGGFSGGENVDAFMPTVTTAGSPVAGINGSCVIDSTTFLITAFEIVINNNVREVADEAFQGGTTDLIPDFREVTGSLTMRARRDTMVEFAERRKLGTSDIALTLGSGNGTTVVIDLDQVEWEFSPLEVPEQEEATYTLPFRALGSSGEDEIKVTFQ